MKKLVLSIALLALCGSVSATVGEAIDNALATPSAIVHGDYHHDGYYAGHPHLSRWSREAHQDRVMRHREDERHAAAMRRANGY